MDKNTKITLEALLARKEQAIAAKKKPQTRDLYVKSLDGVITVREPSRTEVSDARQEEDAMLVDRYLVYECIVSPNLRDKELLMAYGCAGEPDRILDYILKMGEITQISQELMKMAGYDENVRQVEKEEIGQVKN
ncbi:MAG: hypothetical protein LUC95_08295 [Lachnospiraceae bacterium]|nr:hypothetical protein [Lachnospiraceae bacterium]